MAKKKAMRGGGMMSVKKKAGMRGGGMAKKSGPAKKKIMKGGGMAKKAGPAKKKVMKKGGMAKKAGPMKGMAMGGRASMDAGRSRRIGARALPRGMRASQGSGMTGAAARQAALRKAAYDTKAKSMPISKAGIPKPVQGAQKLGMATGGTAKSATSVRMNRGAPKVRTVKARGRGAATKGTQFRENT
jgi:hypothetical protein